jgi:hypothetical protein
MIYSRKRPYLIPLVVLFIVALIVILNLMVKPQLTVETFSQVMPREKWLLTRGTNGQVISSMIDFTRGFTTSYSLNQFERGEYVALDFVFNRNGRKYVSKGDTIIYIISTDVEERIISAAGDLAIAKATLKSLISGEKQALVEEAKARLGYNAKQIEDQKINVSRVEALRTKGLGSDVEYETQKWMLDLYEVERGIYKAQLDNLITGVKPEERELLTTQVNALEATLNSIRERMTKLAIVSPISGRVGVVYSPDTLMSIINDKEIVLHTAIKTKDIELFSAGQHLHLKFGDKEKKIEGEVLTISREVDIVNGEQVAFASILVDNSDGKLMSGMVIENYIEVREMSFWEYLLKHILA